jgi:hypothetical protein
MTELASPVLRRATNHDREKIIALVSEVLREYGLSPDPCRTDADLADIESHYHSRGGIFDVLETADGRGGSVGFIQSTGPPANCARCIFIHRFVARTWPAFARARIETGKEPVFLA